MPLISLLSGLSDELTWRGDVNEMLMKRVFMYFHSWYKRNVVCLSDLSFGHLFFSCHGHLGACSWWFPMEDCWVSIKKRVWFWSALYEKCHHIASIVIRSYSFKNKIDRSWRFFLATVTLVMALGGYPWRTVGFWFYINSTALACLHCAFREIVLKQ